METDCTNIYDIANNIIKAELLEDFNNSNISTFNINNILIVNRKIQDLRVYDSYLDSITNIVMEFMENYFEIIKKPTLTLIINQFKIAFLKTEKTKKEFYDSIVTHIDSFLSEYKNINVKVDRNNKLEIVNALKDIIDRIYNINMQDGKLKVTEYKQSELEYQNKLLTMNEELYRALNIKPKEKLLKGNNRYDNLSKIMTVIILLIKKNLYAPFVESKFELLYPYSFGVNVETFHNCLKNGNNVKHLETFLHEQLSRFTIDFAILKNPYVFNNKFVKELSQLENLYKNSITRDILCKNIMVYIKIYNIQFSLIKNMININTSMNRKFDISSYILYGYLNDIKDANLIIEYANAFIVSVNLEKAKEHEINADNFYNISREELVDDQCISDCKEIGQRNVQEPKPYYNFIKYIWNFYGYQK